MPHSQQTKIPHLSITDTTIQLHIKMKRMTNQLAEKWNILKGTI